jgi:hypothetical protein
VCVSMTHGLRTIITRDIHAQSKSGYASIVLQKDGGSDWTFRIQLVAEERKRPGDPKAG